MDTSKKILLSIVIPYRNIPNLLIRCLESIPIRDDIQIIVVDDCSVKESMINIRNVKRKEAIEYHRTKHPSGGGAARNIGLTHAVGEWITFIDADDFFTPKFNYIVDSLRNLQNDVDILYCTANSIDSEYYTTSNRANTLNGYIQLHQDGHHEGENRLRFTFGEPWCKIVRRRIIEEFQIRFSETTIHNDTKYSYLVGYHARIIASTPYALCTITTRKESVSNTLNESKKLERISIFAEAHKFFRKNDIPEKYVINFLWPQMARSLFENQETYKKGREILRRNGFSSTKILIQTIKHLIRNRVKIYVKKLIKHIG